MCVCVCACVFCAEGRHAIPNIRKTRERGEERAREQESKQNSGEMSWPSGFFFPRGDCQFRLAALNRLRVKPEVQGLPRTEKR